MCSLGQLGSFERMPAACRLVWMLVFPRADSSRAEGPVGARALELAVEGTRSSPRAAYTIVGGRFVDGAAPEKDKRTAI